jgi:transcriptional regulator with XRE-family HTH domain
MRKGRGWSQEELADRVGIHRTYVGDVERGLRNIGLINIGRIAVALGVSVATIMTEVERERTQG